MPGGIGTDAHLSTASMSLWICLPPPSTEVEARCTRLAARAGAQPAAVSNQCGSDTRDDAHAHALGGAARDDDHRRSIRS
jgi:hypothetical protein